MKTPKRNHGIDKLLAAIYKRPVGKRYREPEQKNEAPNRAPEVTDE